MKVYLDNAATTPIYPEVAELMHRYSLEDFGNPSSVHSHGQKARALVEKSRKVIADNIHSKSSDVFFTSGATEANNTILKNSVAHLGIKRIISSPVEHHSVIKTLDYLSLTNSCEVILLEVNAQGFPNLEQLQHLLQSSEEKTLVSLMHGNNEIGTMTSPEIIGKLCEEYGALFHCDAVQTTGKYPIDVQKFKVHFLTGSGHKFHGPKGIGFMYIHSDHRLGSFIHGGAQERNLRAGTENVMGIVGMSEGLRISHSNLVENHALTLSLRQHLKDRISAEIPDVLFNGAQEAPFLAHVLNVSFPAGEHTEYLVMNLDINGVSVSSGSACSAGIEEESHVLRAIQHPSERKAIRFSISELNTQEEIDYTVECLKKILL